MDFMEIVKAEAFWGLIGAGIGGLVSIKASQMQVDSQQKVLREQQEEQHKKTMLVIIRFIKKEVSHNYHVFVDKNEKHFPLEMIKGFSYHDFIKAFESYSIKSIFQFETDHYDKFKYEIAYMENGYANELIDFYDLFELISTLDFREWSEDQFDFFKQTIERLETFLVTDYDHW